MTFTLVVPVKGTVGAKSRMGASFELAMAIALDTVEVALRVAPVVVVTSADAASTFRLLGADVIEEPGGGLNAAIAAGIATLDGAVGVLLGDLPALRSDELSEALDLASSFRRAFVSDADNVGTTMITALSGASHRPTFGGASRAAHLAAGYTELPIAVGSGLRHDVDTSAQLAALQGLGPRTRLITGR